MAEFVKAVLEPLYRARVLSRDDFKNLVKKATDKVGPGAGLQQHAAAAEA